MGGKAPKAEKLDVLDPAQREVLQQILGADLSQFFDPARQQEFFQAQVADPAIRQFQQQVVPALQEEFVGQGAASSSGLNRALASAGGELEAQLASQLSSFQQAGQANQLQLLAQALGLQGFQPVVNPGKPGLGAPIGSALGAAGGFLVGGPAGAQLGAGIGGSVGSAF